MADQSQIAEQFRTKYVHALTDVENGKEKSKKKKDSDYAALGRFINDLKAAKVAQSLDTCITQYLKIYLRYSSPTDRRSKMAFVHLLSSRIDVSAPGDSFLPRISHELTDVKQPYTTLRVRFESLEDNQKREILQLLKYYENLKKQHASILDELQEAYAASHEQKKATTLQQLYLFDPLRDNSLKKSLSSLTGECTKAWDQCTKELSETNWAQFQKSFNDFVDFLRQNQTQKLRLFQILKWCREPLGTPRKVPYKGGVVVLTPDSDPLKNEFYFQTVYALFLRAIQIVNPVLYQRGFPQKEEEFFLDQLAYRLYTSNYRDRLKQGISKAGDFRKTSTSFLWLLLFAQKRDLTLVPDDKFKEIAQIYGAVVHGAVINASAKESQSETSQPKPPNRVKRISTRGKSTWDFAKGYLKLGDRIGAGLRETEIVYMEGEETRTPQIYIEFTQMRGPLFVGNLNTIINRLERMPYELIWEANKGLILLIAQYFGFLFTMFFPGVGYFGAFLDVGFSGVLRQVVSQEALDEILSQLSKQGASSSLPPDVLAVLSLLTSGRKAPAKLAQAAKREALKQAESDVRLIEGRSTSLLAEEGQGISQLEERSLGDVGAGTPLTDAENRGLSKPTKQVQAIEHRTVETDVAESAKGKQTGVKKTTFREAEDAEPRAKPVSAKTSSKSKRAAKKGREIEAEGGEDPKLGKRAVDADDRGTADNGLKQPPKITRVGEGISGRRTTPYKPTARGAQPPLSPRIKDRVSTGTWSQHGQVPVNERGYRFTRPSGRPAADFHEYEGGWNCQIAEPYAKDISNKDVLKLGPDDVGYKTAPSSTVNWLKMQKPWGGKDVPLARRPDATMEVWEKLPGGGQAMTEAHFLEATLQSDFAAAGHKQNQIAGTVWLSGARSGYSPNTKMYYHIFAPRPPTDFTVAFLEDMMRQFPNLEINWIVVPISPEFEVRGIRRLGGMVEIR